MAGSFFFYYFRNRPLLQNGLVRPTHVDVHPEKACNGPCAHCIGKSDSQAKRVEKRLNRGNIAGVLDRVITPDHVPYLHIAGFTGDCLVKSDYQEDRPRGRTNIIQQPIWHDWAFLINYLYPWK